MTPILHNCRLEFFLKIKNSACNSLQMTKLRRFLSRICTRDGQLNYDFRISIYSDIKIISLILRQTTTRITTKISYCSNPATSILHHYRTSDHDVYISENYLNTCKNLYKSIDFIQHKSSHLYGSYYQRRSLKFTFLFIYNHC